MSPHVHTDSHAQPESLPSAAAHFLRGAALLSSVSPATQVEATVPAPAKPSARCLGEEEKNCNQPKPCGTEPELQALEDHPATWAWREARSGRLAARSERPGDWYDQRAQGELRSLPGRGRACGRVVTVELTCTACGLFHARTYACGIRQACDACCARYYRRQRARLIRACGRAAGTEYTRWRNRGCPRVREGVDGSGGPRLRMLTLTVRHSGDPAVDRDRIALGWVRLRAWVHKRLHYAPTFVLAWEMTPGEDGGLGHVHAHVVTWWPWLDWAALHQEWTDATDGYGLNIDTGASSARAREAQRGRKPAERAAYYASKYASKDELRALFSDVDRLAAWYRATRGRRLHSTSRAFWLDEPARTPCCRAPFLLQKARGTSYAIRHADDGPSARAAPN